MSAAGWMAFSIICFTLAGLFLALSVLLFIRYKIPRVIGDLSGRQAAKEVAALRGDSEAQKTARAHSGHTSDFKAMAMAHENKRLLQYQILQHVMIDQQKYPLLQHERGHLLPDHILQHVIHNQ